MSRRRLYDKMTTVDYPAIVSKYLGQVNGEAVHELLQAAEAAEHAYSPYSRLSVGAVVSLESGKQFSGCNVENASYPVGTCAERNALAAAQRYVGRSKDRPRHFALIAIGGDAELVPCSPCGACRQAIAEFNPQCLVQFVSDSPSGLRVIEASIADLLPYSFTTPG
jgi:cytidine deaminase